MSAPIRGVALLTRGPDGRNLMAAAAGSDVQGLTAACLVEAVSRGGSDHPEDWMAWTLNRTPSSTLLGEIERRVSSGQAGASHPAVTGTIFDTRHPKLVN